MEKPSEEVDHLASDLVNIVNKYVDDSTELMSELLIYITAREHKIKTHAYRMGKMLRP